MCKIGGQLLLLIILVMAGDDSNMVRAMISNRTVRFSVIAPDDPGHSQSLRIIYPIIEMAIRNISDTVTGILPGWKMKATPFDSNCSSTYGPLAAFKVKDSTDAFIGPVCDYVIAPVCRYAGVWKIPVLTAGGQTDSFNHKTEYKTLTRVMGSYGHVSHGIRKILAHFGWSVIGILYFNHGLTANKGLSKCHFMLVPVFVLFGYKTVHRSFNETATPQDFRNLLTEISESARIVVVCADPLTVRNILLVAEELNMIDSGEYVFFNLELFNSTLTHTPWHVANDTEERNNRAKKAFTALLTVTAKTPDTPAYLNFSDEIKKIAHESHNFTFGPDPVSTFVTAFYDAVLLYAHALNETLAYGFNGSIGEEITKRMWNRTIQGITGPVVIDPNGDRITDYSLLDMDPVTNSFQIVAHYNGVKQELEMVPGAKIHWAGGRQHPPPDTPACGFDNSLCKTMPVYAILSIVLSSVVVVLAIASAFMYRFRCTSLPVSQIRQPQCT